MNSLIKSLSLTALAVPLTLSLLSPNALADGRRDLYYQQSTQRYTDQPTTARELSMAGAGIPTSTDSSSTVGNPAGLGFMRDGEISGTYGYNTVSGNEHPSYKEIEQNTNSGLVLGALPVAPVEDDLPDWGNIGFGWSGYDSGDYDDSTYGLNQKGNRVHLAYGKALDADWSVGYGLTWFDDELSADQFDYKSDNSFRHTLGVQNKVDEDLSWGLSAFMGYGTHDVEYADNSESTGVDQTEFGVDFGLGYRVAEGTQLAFAVDYKNYDSDGDVKTGDINIPHGGDEHGDSFGARIGIEQVVTDWLNVRGGYRYAGNQDYYFDRPELSILSGSAKYNAWSLGAGFIIPVDHKYIKAVNIDYGVEYREVGYRDWEHLVTASIPFGVCQ